MDDLQQDNVQDNVQDNNTDNNTDNGSANKYNGTIVGAQFSKDSNTRLTITTDVTFYSFDKDGNPCESTSFSRAIYTLCNEIAKVAPKSLFAFALASCLGKRMSSQFIGLLLQGAQISFVRELKHAGELRSDGESIFERDTYVTTITKYSNVPNQMLVSLVQTAIVNGTIAEQETPSAMSTPTWSFE